MLPFVSRKKYQELEEMYRAKRNEAEINYSLYDGKISGAIAAKEQMEKLGEAEV